MSEDRDKADDVKDRDHTVHPRPLDPEEVRRARERTEEALERMREARARVDRILKKAMDE